MKKRDILNPTYVRIAIDEISRNTIAVPALHVASVDWKSFLSFRFKLRAELKINNLHRFPFRSRGVNGASSVPRTCFARKLPTSGDWSTFNLFKRGIVFHELDFSDVRKRTSEFIALITRIEDVPHGKSTRKEYFLR